MRPLFVSCLFLLSLGLSSCTANTSSRKGTGFSDWLARRPAETPHRPLAEAYHRRGRPELAAQLYESSVARSPNDPHLRYLWAHSLASAGHEKEAIYQVRRSLQIDPNQPKAALLLAVLWRRQGENEKSIELLEKSWNGQPRLWEAGRELADWHLARGEANEACRLLEQVVQHSPDDLRARFLHADALERANRWPEARQAWESLARHNPSDDRIQSHLASIAQVMGNQDDPALPSAFVASKESNPPRPKPLPARWEYPPLPGTP